MHTARCVPLVGAMATTILPAGEQTIVTLAPNVAVTMPVGIPGLGALVVAPPPLYGMRVYLCTGVMTAPFVAPPGAKLWLVAAYGMTNRIVVPELIQSIGFTTPGLGDIAFWLEDEQPAAAAPFNTVSP